MPRRPWALCALVLLVGCATSEPAARSKKKHAAPVEAAQADDEEETEVPVPAKAPEPRRAEPPAEAPRAPEPAHAPVASAEPRTAAPAEPAPAPARSATDPFGDVGFHEVNEKDWLAGIREKIAKQEKVPPTDLRLSPGLLRAA